MLTQEDDVEIHALARRGWSVSAIARHTGRDRKTVAKYLAGKAPVRAPAPSCLEPFRPYLEARFEDDPHVLATTLFEELGRSGSIARIRRWCARSASSGCVRCASCCKAGGVKVTVGLEHEPGEELQLDWLELSETPWGEKAYVLVGALSHSGRVRGVFSEGESFAHLVEALDGVLRRLGGTARSWRTDRMATVVVPGNRSAAAGGRGDGEALRRADHGVPGEPTAAQGRGREGDRVCDAVVVALGAGVDAGAGAGRSGPLVRRGRPIAAAAASAPSASWRRQSRCCRCRSCRSRREYRERAGRLARARWSRSRPTATASRPATLARRSRSGPARRAAPGDLHARGPPDRTASPRARRRRADDPHARAREHARAGGARRSSPRASRCPRKPNRPPGERALAEAAKLRGQSPEAWSSTSSSGQRPRRR